MCEEAEQNPLLSFTISLCGLAAALLVRGRALGIRLGARPGTLFSPLQGCMRVGSEQESARVQTGSLCMREHMYMFQRVFNSVWVIKS